MGVNNMNKIIDEPVNNAGRIGFNIRGYYSELNTYDFLDVVYHGNSSFVAKQTTVGNTPAESNEFWQILARGIGENASTPNYWQMTSQNGKGSFIQIGTTWIVTAPTMSQASDAATAYWGVKLATECEYTIQFGIAGGTNDDSAYVNVSSTTDAHYQFSKIGNGDVIKKVRLPRDAWVWMKFQHYSSNTDDAFAYLILEPIIMINNQIPEFETATTRENIKSGDAINSLFGKIRKWFADLKTVAFTGSYNDLLNQPQSLKNPNALTFTGAVTGSYDGSVAKTVAIPKAVAVKGNAESTYRTGNVNLTPANIGAVATSKVLTTGEQINANTNAENVAGATALKAMVGQLNSNIDSKIGCKLKVETLICSAGIIRNYIFPDLPTHTFTFPIITSCSRGYEGVTTGRNIDEDGSVWVYSPVDQNVTVCLAMLV